MLTTIVHESYYYNLVEYHQLWRTKMPDCHVIVLSSSVVHIDLTWIFNYFSIFAQIGCEGPAKLSVSGSFRQLSVECQCGDNKFERHTTANYHARSVQSLFLCYNWQALLALCSPAKAKSKSSISVSPQRNTRFSERVQYLFNWQSRITIGLGITLSLSRTSRVWWKIFLLTWEFRNRSPTSDTAATVKWMK